MDVRSPTCRLEGGSRPRSVGSTHRASACRSGERCTGSATGRRKRSQGNATVGAAIRRTLARRLRGLWSVRDRGVAVLGVPAVQRARPPAWSSYHGEVVGPDGRTSRLRVASLPAAYRGFGLAAARLTSQPRPKQLAVCRVYADAVGAAGSPVGELRIYRVAHVVLPREGGRPTTPVARTLVARCAPSDDP